MLDAQHDTGLFVRSILLNREKTLGREILGATDYYTPLEIIEELRKAKPEAGKSLTFKKLSVEEYRQLLASKGWPPVVQEEFIENMLLL